MKDFIMISLYHVVNYISNIVTYIIGLFIHPLRNISFWAVVFLIYFLNKNDGIALTEKDMFLFSVGLVTILTFIVTYFDSHTVDLNQKENYYLGYNVKKLNLYSNSWVNNFNEIPIKLFLWIVASFPVIKIGLKYEYNLDIVETITNFLKGYNDYLDLIWLSVVIVICFYCAGILIELVSLSRSSFYRSRLYDSTGKYVKYIIELEIKKRFKIIFRNLFKGNKTYELITKSSKLTNFIFTEANNVTNNEEEFIKYINIVYSQENDAMSKIITKIESSIKSINKENTNWVFNEIRRYILKAQLKKLKRYYTGKWKWLEQSNVLSPVFLLIVNYDLTNLIKLEMKFNSKKEESFQIYREIFWGIYSDNEFLLVNHHKEEENVYIAQMINIIRKNLKDCQFYESLSDLKDMYYLFNTIKRVNDVTKNTSYLSNVFNVFYDCILSSLKDNILIDKNELSSAVDKELNSMSMYNDFLLDEMSRCSYNKLINGNEVSNIELEYILKYLNFKEVIIALIFTLAYNERTYKGIISVDQFKIWKSRIREFKYDKKNSLIYLKKHNFNSELFDVIEQSNISHFTDKSFLEWVWESLFIDFDEKEYKEFHRLGVKGIRKNFSLSSYIVLRILVLKNEDLRYMNLRFNDDNKIREELAVIQDILKEEGESVTLS